MKNIMIINREYHFIIAKSAVGLWVIMFRFRIGHFSFDFMNGLFTVLNYKTGNLLKIF